jgi:hypothetical protein
METGGEEEKRIMGKGKTEASFVDAAFAKEECLTPGCQSITDNLPFLKTNRGGFQI